MVGDSAQTLPQAGAAQAPTREAVIWAYRLILGREPEGEEAIAFQMHAATVADLRAGFLGSAEFNLSNADLLSRAVCRATCEERWRQDSAWFYAVIAGAGITAQDLHRAYAEVGMQDDFYAVYHLNRFHELFAFLAAHFAGRSEPARLLEIGVSPHTTGFYRRFLPCTIDTVDRPLDQGGLTPEWAASAGVGRHWSVDLNTFDLAQGAAAEVPDGRYDAVICCEVVEHLTRAPRDTIRLALAKLKPDGILYLTTPNYLTPERAWLPYIGRSGAQPFTHYQNNLHAHHHFREYTMREMIDEVVEGGGVAERMILSHCWDKDPAAHAEPAYRANQTLVVRAA